MTDPGFRTATDLVGALRTSEVGSRELLEHLLNRVEAHDPALNAVVTLDADRARAAADEADAATARGEVRGPLHGLPMTVKDCFETAGLRTTCGAPELADHVPDVDAVTVARLRAAGAIVFGKTNTPTYTSDIQTTNPVFGTTNNPWDTDRTPGGSSGGSAAALAAGLTPLELGSDIGGSIRSPSHHCGTHGHKPSFGVVPTRGHIPGPPGWLGRGDVNVCGPMARSVDDLVLAFDVLAGPDEPDAAGWRLDLPPAPETLRVGVWADEPDLPVAPDVAAVLAAAVDRLADAGLTVEATRPAIDVEVAAHLYEQLVWTVLSSEVDDETWELAKAVADAPVEGEEPLLFRGGRATAMRHRDWIALDEARQHQRVAWAELFTQVDVLLCPVFPVAAFRHQVDDDPLGILNRTVDVGGQPVAHGALTHWCGVVGVSYLPATVVPAGHTDDGRPVGVQVVADFLRDRTALSAAARIDEALGGFRPPPGYGA